MVQWTIEWKGLIDPLIEKRLISFDIFLMIQVGWFPRNHVRPATEVEIQNTRNSAKSGE